MILLTACSTANLSEKAVVQSRKVAMPDVKKYPESDLIKAGKELKACERSKELDCSMIEKLLIDAKILRRQVIHLIENL